MLIPNVICFLRRNAQVEASSQALLAVKRYSDAAYSQRLPKEMKGLLLVAYFGIETVLQLLLATGQVEIDSKDTRGRTRLL
jgi:hypothetical protein